MNQHEYSVMKHVHDNQTGGLSCIHCMTHGLTYSAIRSLVDAQLLDLHSSIGAETRVSITPQGREEYARQSFMRKLGAR